MIKINETGKICVCCNKEKTQGDMLFCSEHRYDWTRYIYGYYGIKQLPEQTIIIALNTYVKQFKR